MKDLSDVTALIITIGRDPFLLECVSSLRREYPEIKIIVGDQNEIDGRRIKQIGEAGADEMIPLPWDCGVPIGRNRVLEEIKTEYLLLIDDDFSFNQDSNLGAMREVAEIYDICGSHLLKKAKAWQEYQGFITKEGDKMVWRKLPADVTYFHLPHNPDVAYYPVDLTLNFFIAKTESVRKVKWDENITVSYEHSDFFLMARDKGLRVAYTPDSFAVHKPPWVKLDEDQERSYLRSRKRRDDREYFFRKWEVDTLIDFNGNIDRLTLPAYNHDRGF